MLNEICLVAKLGREVIGVCNVTSDQDTKTKSYW